MNSIRSFTRLATAAIVLFLGIPPDPGWGQMIAEHGGLAVPERRTQQWASGLGNRELIEQPHRVAADRRLATGKTQHRNA